MVEKLVVDCVISRKHQGEFLVPGGAVYEDDLVYAGHASIADGEESTYLGAFLVEPKRHAPGIGDLIGPEAERIGLVASRLGRALTEVTAAGHVYLFVLGHHVDHLHLWLVPRYPGTPREYWGQRLDEWPDAPRGGVVAIEDLCRRVRENLDW